jgi:hypothetical protein
MDDTLTPAAGADSAARDEGFANVSDAVAELERREKARAAAKRAERQASDADEGSDDDADEREDKRHAEREADRKAKARADDGEGDEGDDDAAEGDDDAEADDDEDDKPRKRRADSGDEEDDDAEDAEDARQRQREHPAPKIRLNLDGREVEATPDEVQTYVRQAAEERQQVAQMRQHIVQEAQALQQQGQQLAQLAQALLGQEPALELAQSDPGAYIAQQALHRQRLQLVQQLQEHTQRAAQIAQAQQQQAFAQSVDRERQALLKAMPELADPAKLAAFQGRVFKVAQKYGIGPQELGNAFDHRSFLMLRDLARLADMEEAQSRNREKVREKLRNAQPLQPPKSGAVQRPRETQEIRAREAKKAFMKSGRTDRDVRRYLQRLSPD